MAGSLIFKLNDLYPQPFGGLDTSTTVVPDAESQELLNEDKATAEAVNPKSTSGKSIMTAIFLIACLIVFFGVNE